MTGPPLKGVAAPNRRRRHGPPAAAILVAAVLSVLAAGCGGGSGSSGSGGSPNAGGSTVSASPVVYSACVRSHGVPNYPDPDSSGQLPKTDAGQLGVSSSQYEAAQHACQHLLPTGGSTRQQEGECMQNHDCPQALVQQMMTWDRKLAQCMRSHGVSNFPDPTNGGSSGPWFNITKAGISDAASHSRPFTSKLDECGRLVGLNAPQSFG
jgi:hypothetical protein